MLVQLSPWQTAKTSVPVATKRRRKRGENAEQHCAPNEDFVASFVASAKRYRTSKKRKDSGTKQETVPLLSITCPHRVGVVGWTASGVDEPSTLECSQWQFMSRPGKSTCFFQDNDACNLPKIPAIFDGRNDKMYGLQNNNSTLCCWHSENSSGPDDKSTPATKISLSSPIVSLSLLSFRKGVLYGALQDGRVFVAMWDEKDVLNITYAEPPVQQSALHLSTTIQWVGSNSAGKVGQKRKAPTGDGDVALYQVFLNENDEVVLYRREINLSDPDCLEGSSVQECVVGKIPSLEKGWSVNRSTFHVSRVDESSIAIVYRIQSEDKSEQRYYCAPLTLLQARFIRSPFVLADDTRQARVVTSSILAVAALDQVLLYDLFRGIVVHRSSVTDVVGECKTWTLVTEARKGRLAILSVQEGHVHVGISKATFDEAPHHQVKDETGYNLSVGLSSSLSSSTASHNVRPGRTRRNAIKALSSTASSKLADRCLQDCIMESLVRLRACVKDIQDPAILDMQPHCLLNEYEKAIFAILSTSPTSWLPESRDFSKADGQKAVLGPNGIRQVKETDSTHDGKQSKSPKKSAPTNGSSHVPLNGIVVPTSVQGYTPACIPQQFVDGAASIVLSTLQLPFVENKPVGFRIMLARLDARLILSRLLRTGKLSARKHFVERYGKEDDDPFFTILRSLKLTNKKGKRVFSPVDLMHDTLSYCPDVSERQMVSMIHYMLCKALPDDVAENFLEPGNLESRHPYRLLAKRYFQTRFAGNRSTNHDDKEDSQLNNEAEMLSYKLLRAGALVLVRRIVHYSSSNETLLRSALFDGLPLKHEPYVLSRILLDLLEGDKIEAGVLRNERISPSCRTSMISKWIHSLCEACGDRLVVPDSGSDEHEQPLNRILHSVRATLESTEAVISLRNSLDQFGMPRPEREGEKQLANDVEKEQTRNREVALIPSYSIERLVC